MPLNNQTKNMIDFYRISKYKYIKYSNIKLSIFFVFLQRKQGETKNLNIREELKLRIYQVTALNKFHSFSHRNFSPYINY